MFIFSQEPQSELDISIIYVTWCWPLWLSSTGKNGESDKSRSVQKADENFCAWHKWSRVRALMTLAISSAARACPSWPHTKRQSWLFKGIKKLLVYTDRSSISTLRFTEAGKKKFPYMNVTWITWGVWPTSAGRLFQLLIWELDKGASRHFWSRASGMRYQNKHCFGVRYWSEVCKEPSFPPAASTRGQRCRRL